MGFDQELTDRLAELSDGAAHPELLAADGSPVRRADLLARFVWDAALGIERNPETGEVTFTAPKKWAMEFVFERLEGRAAQAAPKKDESRRMTAADKVEDLAREQVNDLTDEILEDSDEGNDGEDGEQRGTGGTKLPPPPPPSLNIPREKGDPDE